MRGRVASSISWLLRVFDGTDASLRSVSYSYADIHGACGIACRGIGTDPVETHDNDEALVATIRTWRYQSVHPLRIDFSGTIFGACSAD